MSNTHHLARHRLERYRTDGPGMERRLSQAQGSTGYNIYIALTTATTNMAAANFVVITNGGGGGARLLEQPISTNSVPRAFFPRVAIGCRLSLKIYRNLEGSLSLATWDDTAWIGGTASGTSYISVHVCM